MNINDSGRSGNVKTYNIIKVEYDWLRCGGLSQSWFEFEFESDLSNS